MIGCSKKCGQNYPEKDQRRENETWVKSFTLGWCLSTYKGPVYMEVGDPR